MDNDFEQFKKTGEIKYYLNYKKKLKEKEINKKNENTNNKGDNNRFNRL